MDVRAEDLSEVLKRQRNGFADECAMFQAACASYERKIATLQARIAELEKPKE
jgi:hypothetical protein